MKRTTLIMILGTLTMLLLLHLSCATAKKDQESPVLSDQVQAADETSVEVEAMPLEALLLADKHKAAGIECNDCHQETPPASDVLTEVCMTCHEDYNEVATSYIDPHSAHMVYSRCGDCHHAHKTSENQCLSCHSFNLQAP